MKGILFIIVFVFFSGIGLKAAHIIGGDFSVSWVEGNTFAADLKLFRDCFGGGAAFDATITITIYDSNTDTIFGFFDMSNPQITGINLGDECYTPTSLCVEQGEYTANIDLPDNPGGYYLSWERCCRNSIITNLAFPGDEGMVFTCSIADPALHNSSPVFDVYPSTGYFCIGVENTLNFNVTDVDGDSLVYFFDNPLSGDATSSSSPVSGVAGPRPYTPCTWAAGYSLDNILNTTIPMTIDEGSGTITVIPEELGVYVFAVYVAELRNGAVIGAVRREIQFQTVVCTVDYPALFTSPTDTLFEIIAENLFEIPVIVEDQNTGDPLIVVAESELFTPNAGFPAVFEGGTGIGSVSTEFSWQTSCVNISNVYHEVNLKAFSDGCSGSDTTYFTFYVKVNPDVEGWIERAPNVITPNNDGINEYFSINVSINPCFDTFKVFIYDRWGKNVFTSEDPFFQWHGEDQDTGKELQDGTYFYIIDASFEDVPYRKTSSLSILR
jgi:gliding motility-associated-like protein